MIACLPPCLECIYTETSCTSCLDPSFSPPFCFDCLDGYFMDNLIISSCSSNYLFIYYYILI